ncbi:MAG: PIN domain-containing protein [Bifidobacteriaceae bacterium]|jgi:predicted nucleic acid-binding protein|nr:PIN domain-containing protein [Bifidobacteriaceae bacterium]
MAPPAVFIDANALVPISLANLLLRIAEEGLIEPFWSSQVLAEARFWAKELNPGTPSASIDRRFADMAQAFDAAIIGTDGIDPGDYPSKDPDDTMVIGAAHRSPADTIITRNLGDFPRSTLDRHGLRAITADQLLLNLLKANPDQIYGVVTDMQSAMKRPPLSIAAILDSLAKAGVPRFAAALNDRLGTLAGGVPRA